MHIDQINYLGDGIREILFSKINSGELNMDPVIISNMIINFTKSDEEITPLLPDFVADILDQNTIQEIHVFLSEYPQNRADSSIA